MSISSLGAGLSGLQSFQRAQDVTANNIANVDTNGFKPQQANFQAQPNGGVNALVSGGPTVAQSLTAPAAALQGGTGSAPTTDTPAPSGTDLTKETVNSLEYKYGFDMSAQVVKTTDQMLGTLINIQA